MNHDDKIEGEELLMTFPCLFPLKIVGEKSEAFKKIILGVIQSHAPEVTDSDIQERDSGKGKYCALTVTITATSRSQLDDLYQSLSGHELVKFVL